jgi:regulator of RNase E activity RraB
MTRDDDAVQLDADRRTVRALEVHGDPLTKARQVDHWVYFATAKGRDRFVKEVTQLGFRVDDKYRADAPKSFCARVSRVSHVDLESIHRVVMTLFVAAEQYDGEYDGWGCPVETEG